MKLQCLIKSRYPGLYNREMDFGPLGIASVVEGVADVGPALANVMVASGNFVRIDEFKDLAAPEPVVEPVIDAPETEDKPIVSKKRKG